MSGINVTIGNPAVTVVVGAARVNVSNDAAQGPAGPSGSAGFTHSQPVASATWTINHNLGYYPCVNLYDASGFEMVGDVFNMSTNVMIVTFTAPYAGTARLT